jgi:hypothetical protein
MKQYKPETLSDAEIASMTEGVKLAKLPPTEIWPRALATIAADRKRIAELEDRIAFLKSHA